MTSERSPFVSDVLKGKVSLITGGSSGIGFEIARQLGRHGSKIAISGRRKDVLGTAASTLESEGIEVLQLQGDVRSESTCERWIHEVEQRWGPKLDVLVNCAAGNFLARAEALSSNGFKAVMDIDAVGTFNMSRAAYRLLRNAASGSGGGNFSSPNFTTASLPLHLPGPSPASSPSGSSSSATIQIGDALVINISATLQYGATWWQAHASAAKSAVDSLTRSLALEWGESGIRVNAIAPGPIRGTAGVAKLLPEAQQRNGTGTGKEKEKEKEQKEDGSSPESMYVPLRGQMGTTWDIAMASLFLASPAARFMSGATMVVDGASWLWRTPAVTREAVDAVSRSVEGSSRRKGHADEEAAPSKVKSKAAAEGEGPKSKL